MPHYPLPTRSVKYLSYDAPHNPLPTRPSTSLFDAPLTIRYLRGQHLTVKMFSATSFAEPKLSELVPTLTGHTAQPIPEDPTLPE
ncbi:hypothetical protein N7501_006523 [Penicillium viridicatum]|nr:hypothetical protein N7501_006523 [Penicillium viridicatum]